MKATGVVRRLDELGRITLPIELRRSLQLNDRCSIEIFVEDNTIILKKHSDSDIFTGDKDDLIEYEGKLISRKNILKMAKIAGLNIIDE